MATDRLTEVQGLFVTGLRNAHAVENQALALMNRQIERLEHYPEMADRLRQHVQETNGQIARLDEILASLDASASTLKDIGLSALGNMAAMTNAMADDEILKNSFSSFAFENFEIASYMSLIAMAEACGRGVSVPGLTLSLQEEQSMAGWIQDNVVMVTRRYIDLSAAGHHAKN